MIGQVKRQLVEPSKVCEEMVFCWCALALLTLAPVVTGNNAGVKVRLTQRGLDYATINEYAAIDYSLRSVDITDTSIELGLKGIFYNTPRTQEPRFPSTAVSCTSLNSKMFCVAISAFTINSAFSVFHNTGVFNITITDDMISEKYPDLKLELEVKTVKEPDIQFEPNNVILKIFSTVTAVQSGNRLTQLFILNLESSASVQVSVREDKLVLALNLEKIDVSMNTKTFKFTNLSFLNMAIKDILFPIIKAHLAKDFPLPGLLRSTMVRFINPQVEVLKDYVMIGTDIQFGENT
ncbi:bactericidal permeability-increasing -like protein [Labeo rohita]|uniref:Bactericidal permeability-increasing protein n=1 Tax=Labeo rohita TaxID=84645 RepID=A0A498LVH9_LABRO|nr:bactericidal permeability-increasing -like protein [Labeo rohita]